MKKFASARRACARRWGAMKSGLKRKWRLTGGFSPPLFWFFLFALLVFLAYVTYDSFWLRNQSELAKGIYVEFYGLIFDVLFIGLMFGLYDHVRVRRLEVQRQQEIIDDFKKWDSEESRLRIAGAVRRLNALGKTDLDFRGIVLKDFSFKGHDIGSIRGATFYDGVWGEISPRVETTLEQVGFDHIDCSDVMFSPFHPFKSFKIRSPVKMKNCSFIETRLCNSKLCGVELSWDKKPPEETGEGVENPDGTYSWLQTYHSPFFDADLKGASFADAEFRNADFRDARNVLEANFTGATGLETCVFDNEEIRNAILSVSKEATDNGEEKAE